jgi:hypothetical protein
MLVVATVAAGLVLVTSLPLGPNNELAATTLPALLISAEIKHVFTQIVGPDFTSTSQSLWGIRGNYE